MPDYSKHSDVLILLKEAQEADQDNREKVLEAQWFIEKEDGQWEPEWWEANSGKPRYTFDMTSPIVDQIAGEIEQADFDIKVRPAGGESSKETAMLLDGLIRNIENISNASTIYAHAGRNMVATGIDGWRVVQEYCDGTSYDQDLVIKPIYNFSERVWFDVGSQTRDRSDSKYCFVLQAIPTDEYKERFPKGSEQSVSSGRTKTGYYQKAATIVCGQIYYAKTEKTEIARLSDGKIIELTDETKAVLDELAANGITVAESRPRKKTVIYSRLFDGSDWLTPEQRTVFSSIPVIPTYGNFKVIEDKTVYRGVVQKLMDPQRVMNYSLSREIEEGALAPRAKYWMTPKQAAGHEGKLKSLNTNSDPVQFYNADAAAPGPPQQSGGAQINPGLRTVSESMRQIMGQTAGMFAANMGDNPGLQSGVAIQSLQQKGDNGTVKYFKALEIAICQTARVIVDAMPRVYDTTRQARILNPDGSFEMQTLNQTVIDGQTGKPIVLNDLSKGKYDVTCSAGPSFQSRMQETVKAITEMAAYDPSIIQTGADVLFNNLDSPGMDVIADRKRRQLLSAGIIPPAQQTDEEKAEIAQAQAQPKAKDPATQIAEAEALKAQAEASMAQTKARIAQTEAEEAAIKLQQAQEKLRLQDDKQNDENAQKMLDRSHEKEIAKIKAIADFRTAVTVAAMKTQPGAPAVANVENAVYSLAQEIRGMPEEEFFRSMIPQQPEPEEPKVDIAALVTILAQEIRGVADATRLPRVAVYDEAGNITAGVPAQIQQQRVN